MKSVYTDQAATTFPKAPGVVDAMVEFMTRIGANVSRGSYESSHLAEHVVYETRSQLAELLGPVKPEQVVFTRNITESLNVLLKGFLKPGDHVITSGMEHNAVMRPLHSLEDKGVEVSRVPCTLEGLVIVEELEPLIRPNTKVIVMLHASNVCGTIQPLEQVGVIARKHGLKFIVDGAQTIGVMPCSLESLHADAIAFTGHKGLLGPQGLGGFVLTEEMARLTAPLIEGGTGSRSESEAQPEFMPDKFESGTPNIPGIYGLNAALKFVLDTGIDAIHRKEMALTQAFLDGLSGMDHIRVIGLPGVEGRTAVVALDFPGEDTGLVAHHLESGYGIKTRCGLHCAPAAHKSLGTYPHGAVRFSFGYFNTFAEVEYVLHAISTCKNL